MTDEATTQIIKAVPSQTDTSLLDTLRTRRDEHAVAQTVEMEVPGYNGMVALRLRALTGREQTQVATRLERSRSPEKELTANMDTLILACDEVVVRGEYGEPWQSLGSYDGDEPVAIDARLVELLHLTPTTDTARETLRSLFALAPSPDLAIGSVVNDYIDWMRAANDEIDREFVGESPGSPTSR